MNTLSLLFCKIGLHAYNITKITKYKILKRKKTNSIIKEPIHEKRIIEQKKCVFCNKEKIITKIIR